MTTEDDARTTLLDTAENLFYERGYQAVGMAELRQASGLSLKRIYALYPGKDTLAVAMLDRRDLRWRGELTAFVDRRTDPRSRLLAVFDWLHLWLSGPGHRGCAWINAFGELGGTSVEVVAAVRRHKDAFRTYLGTLCADISGSPTLPDAVFLLAEGCMTTAGITGDPDSARRARGVLEVLLGDG